MGRVAGFETGGRAGAAYFRVRTKGRVNGGRLAILIFFVVRFPGVSNFSGAVGRRPNNNDQSYWEIRGACWQIKNNLEIQNFIGGSVSFFFSSHLFFTEWKCIKFTLIKTSAMRFYISLTYFLFFILFLLGKLGDV